jgi:uncharacterized protein (TIGR03435 family)
VDVAEITRTFLIFLLSCCAILHLASAQTSASQQSAPPASTTAIPLNADPAFDVATIRPTETSATHGTFIRINGRHVLASNMSLQGLIVYAYGLHSSEIVGGPRPLMERTFDVDGVPDAVGHPNRNQTRSMFQKLLVSRFKLKFHYEPRSLTAYAIRVANGGPKLKATSSKPGDGTNFSYTCPPVLTVRNYSMADVAKGLQDAFLDRPVVDQTNLEGRYDFDLKWTADESQTYCSATESDVTPGAPPSLFTAIVEQLGLKLAATKAAIPVMVIDQIEAPSEN